jgi:hypothetical protein
MMLLTSMSIQKKEKPRWRTVAKPAESGLGMGEYNSSPELFNHPLHDGAYINDNRSHLYLQAQMRIIAI